MNNTYAIRVEGLTKDYGTQKVLRGINFSAPSGCVFALLGSNGAGKTTIVKILSTLIGANGGIAEICGVDVAQKPHLIRGMIGLTGQYAAVDELLTGRENMLMIGRLNRTKDLHTRVNMLLERFLIASAADRRVSTYSGGMRRKLDIAMSLLSEPRVLFLDEPTTGLDPQNRLALWDEIRALKQSGVTILLTTQYLDEAEALADHVAILNGGTIAASGTVDELKETIPSGTVVLTFSMNDFDAARAALEPHISEVDAAAGKISILTGGGVPELTAVLIHLKECGIEALSVAQEKTTLEQVFLSKINWKSEVSA